MSKKKHAEHVNHERWLVSYADFITLLFAFFVVLFASSQSDKKKEHQLALAMRSAFSEAQVFAPHSATPAIADGTGQQLAVVAELPVTSSSSLIDGGSGDDVAQHMHLALQKAVSQQIQEGSISIRQSAEGLTVSLNEAGFFTSGSAEIRPEAMSALAKIIATLPIDKKIRVEGHSDNQPIHTTLFASNWELSSARASSIARTILSQTRIDPGMLAAAGYAEFHPIADNATDAGRALNRRVDIVLLRTPSSPAPLSQ